MSRPAKSTHSPGPLTAALVDPLASIICDLRPAWDQYLVRTILDAHRLSTSGAALVRAAVDAADDPDVYDPRAIAWTLRRGEHRPVPRCATCGQAADRCARRPGADDDHEFVEAVRP